MKKLALPRLFVPLLCLFLSALAPSALWAQLSTHTTPYSFRQSLPGRSPVYTIAGFQPAKGEEPADNQFGYTRNVQLNPGNSGRWTVLDNGDQVWRLTIASPGAQTVHLTYRDFWLPEGATLHLYNDDRSQVLGGFTRNNNKGLREAITGFATGLIRGERLTLEYYEPRAVAGRGQIDIAAVIHGFRGVEQVISKAYGDANACQNNVNCAIGNNWQLEKAGVAYIVMGGFLCSGGLMNTFANELVPYLLSADHCSDLDALGDTDASTWLFYWNYETPGCTNPPQNPIFNADVTTGAVLLANNIDTDFSLFRLLEKPTSIGVSYLGWDAGTTPPTSGVGIHHPIGDAKKISIENDPIVSDPRFYNWYYFGVFGNTTDPNTHWLVHYDDGGWEGGSSGSPLFDQNGRVVGQLHGGNGTCPGDNNFEALYGRFDVSWDGNGSGDRRRRLQNWLGQGCVSYRNISTSFTGDEPVYRAFEIDAGNEIAAGAFVRYEGTGSVRLLPGFHAQAGADFRASIGTGCPSSFQAEETAQKSQARQFINTVQTGKPGVTTSPGTAEPIPVLTQQTRADKLPGLRVSAVPNPFRRETSVRWSLLRQQEVGVRLLNAYGQQVRELMHPQVLPAGEYVSDVRAEGLATGLYYVVLSMGRQTISIPVVRMR